LNDGQFELMVHRRLLADDSRGVGEPLNETDGITPYPNPVRLGTGLHIIGSHYVLLDDPTTALKNLRALQSRVYMPFTLAFSPTSNGMDAIKKWIDSHVVIASALSKDLPVNVELMTLQALEGDYLLRLAHQFAVNEDASLSSPVTVDLSTLFVNFPVTDIKEVSLTTTQDVKNIQPFLWNVHGDNANENTASFKSIPFAGETVTIAPMDIRTFTFKVQKNKIN